MKITSSQLTDLLSKTVPAGLPTLTLGAPGVGKSDIHRQAALTNGYDYKVIYPALMEPTDLMGLPVPVGAGDDRRVMRLLDNEMMDIITSNKPTLILIDELGQASPAMQAACAPLLLARTLGGRRIPDHVTICAAANRRADRAGSTSILTHLISRMSVIAELTPDIESWSAWALNNKIDSRVIALLRWRPTLLHQYDADKSYASTEPYPCPRSWASVSGLLGIHLDPALLRLALDGAVGPGAASECSAFLRSADALPDIDDAIRKPSKLKLPSDISALYALACGVAARASAETAAGIIAIADIFFVSKKVELSALIMRDALRIYPLIIQTDAWGKMCKSSLGDVIRHA